MYKYAYLLTYRVVRIQAYALLQRKFCDCDFMTNCTLKLMDQLCRIYSGRRSEFQKSAVPLFVTPRYRPIFDMHRLHISSARHESCAVILLGVSCYYCWTMVAAVPRRVVAWWIHKFSNMCARIEIVRHSGIVAIAALNSRHEQFVPCDSTKARHVLYSSSDCPSVRPSVRPYVTRVDSVKTAKHNYQTFYRPVVP